MKRLSNQVRKFFDIRKDELSISLWMQFYLFLIICALLIVKPTVNALFLSEMGADALATAFVITAVVAVINSYIYNKSLERFPLRYVIRATLLLFSFCFVGMGILVSLGVTTVFLSFFFYILVGMFALVATSQFWVMANVVFNVREAKRLFGFIGAGGIVGGIVGGYTTSLLANQLGNGVLMIIAGFLITLCAFVFNTIWKNRVQKLKNKKRRERSDVSGESSIKLILKSKHLTYLASVIGLGVLVAKLVDYQFSYIASEQIEDPQELASFFGFWFSTFNIVSLLVQLFLTRKILQRADIGVGLVALPAGIIICCALLIFFPELWLVVILKGLDGSLKQSLHKSSVELLALPIPSDVKNKTKTFIDVVVDSLATGAAGLFLIFIIKGLKLPTVYITALTGLLVMYWILIVFKVRASYFGTFKESIINLESLKNNRKSSRQIRKNMKLIFETGSDRDILASLKRVKEVAHPSLIKPVKNLLAHPNNEVKAAAVRVLLILSKDPVPEVQDLIYIKDDQLIVETMEYLLKQDQVSYQFFEQYLDDEDEYIATAALLALAHEAQDHSLVAEQYNLALRVRLFIDEMQSDESHLRIPEMARLIEVLGYTRNNKYHDLIDEFLQHHNPILKNAAIRAAGSTGEERFIPVLIEELEDVRFRESVTTAITSYGDEIIPELEQVLVTGAFSHEAKATVPEIIADLQTKDAFNSLLRMASKGSFTERSVTTKNLYEWRRKGCPYKIKTKTLKNILTKETDIHKLLLDNYYSLKIIERSKLNPNKVISLPEKTSSSQLIRQVKIAMDAGLERIFHLLCLYYDPGDVFVAYRGLISDLKESKLNALEYLDGLLANDLKTLLLPLIKNGTINTELETEDYQSSVNLMDKKDCLKSLSKMNDREIKIKVIDFLRFIPQPYSFKILEEMAQSKSEKIKDLAVTAIDFKNQRSQTA